MGSELYRAVVEIADRPTDILTTIDDTLTFHSAALGEDLTVAVEDEEDPVKIYVAMINDRHSDPEPFVFSTPEAAVNFAGAKAYEYAQDPADVEEEPIDGWLYYARYSTEGDDVWVLEKTLDAGES